MTRRSPYNCLYTLLRSLGVTCLLLMASCGGRHYDETLLHADDIIEEHPDSALAILDATDADDLHSLRDRALYALLLTQARYKCHLPTDDSLINVATAYFDQHNKNTFASRAHYYRGLLYIERGATCEGMLEALRAMKGAQESDDYPLLARINDLFAQIHYNGFNMGEALKYYTRAAALFNLAGMHEHAAFAAIGEANSLSSRNYPARAMRILDSLANTPTGKIHDINHDLNYARTYAFIKARQYPEAVRIYLHEDSVRKLSGLPPLNDPYIAVALARAGYVNKATALIDTLKRISPADTNNFRFAAARHAVACATGNTEIALAERDSMYVRLDNEAAKAFQRDASRTELDFQREINREQRDKQRVTNILFALGLIFTVCAATAFIIIKRRNDKHLIATMARSMFMSDRTIKAQKERITAQEKRLSAQEETIHIQVQRISSQEKELMVKEEAINQSKKLCESMEKQLNVSEELFTKTLSERCDQLHSLAVQYFHIAESPTAKQSIKNRFKELFDKSFEGNNLDTLVNIIDNSHKGIIRRLKTELPRLKRMHLHLLVLMMLDLPSNIIMFLMHMTPAAYYNQCSRLREKLKTLPSPLREEMADLMNNTLTTRSKDADKHTSDEDPTYNIPT